MVVLSWMPDLVNIHIHISAMHSVWKLAIGISIVANCVRTRGRDNGTLPETLAFFDTRMPYPNA
eukprot:2525644-Pleurochrysis_carterae.AAC.1